MAGLASSLFLPQLAGAVTLTIGRTEVFRAALLGSGAPASNRCTTTATVAGSPLKFQCRCDGGNPDCGNISNDPHIEFESNLPGFSTCLINTTADPDAMGGNDPGPISGTTERNFCNDAVFLCSSIGYVNELTTTVGVDELMFELFKFQDGSNPLDPASTPPLRTFFVDDVGTIPAGPTSGFLPTGGSSAFCVLFDGSTNVQGEFGKTNGQYGFRTTVRTQVQSGSAGNITITAVRAYPAGATVDSEDRAVGQKPIVVDVTNVHLVRASATVVGASAGVVVQPYNLTYRLSKDATMFINIVNSGNVNDIVRRIVPGLPRIGEGVPNGTLINGDSWNGRFDNGDLGPPGVYLATLQSFSSDQYGPDLSHAVTRQIALDPLQITDVRVQPLTANATSLAVLTYELTEPATAFIDIYPPNTQFCENIVPNPLNSVNSSALDVPGSIESSSMPPKNFSPALNSCVGAGSTLTPIKRIVEQKESRRAVISFWDGRDRNGVLQPDGNYVFVIYAALPSQNGFAFNTNVNDKRLWTSQARTGYLPISRGNVGITQITPASSVIGSSPAVAGLNPYIFRYTLSRDGLVTMRIIDPNNNLVKTLVNGELRPGLFQNVERWEEPIGDNGLVVSSGTNYMVQLTVSDPLFPAKVSTTTAFFPVSPFRITDVSVTPILSGASDFATITYQLSQTMNVGLNIYQPGTQILATTATWPPCGTLTPGICSQTVNPQGQSIGPVITIRGIKAGRRTIIETWDGRDKNGLFIPDGNYVYTLAAISTTTPQFVAQDKYIGNISVVRGAIVFTSFQVTPDVPRLNNSSNTITLHPFTIEYSMSRQSSVTVQILTTSAPPAVVKTIVLGGVREAGALLQEVWDGRDEKGNFPRSGFYNVRVVAEDVASVLTSGSTAQLTISYDPLRIYDVATVPLRSDTGQGIISYQVSETMKVAVKIYRPGTNFDTAGNPSPAESLSLVQRFVGIRPARTSIDEIWDGTDLKRSLVPDGIYKYRIVASTDVNAIDTITGDVAKGASLSLDNPIDDIPVVRSVAQNPLEDFINNTFAFPNPVTTAKATFRIYIPIQAKVTMKIYNIGGELVYDQDFGEWPSNTCVRDLQCVNGISWDKTNLIGRKLGRGLYYAVIRAEETIGGRSVLQTVEKVLIP